MVKKCDIIRGEKFDAWNLAFKEATLEALTEKNLDAAYFKSSGGRKRGRTDGRRRHSKYKARKLLLKGTASTKKQMKS